ncbi:cysteine synthase A [Sinobacterium caligoides]|uniref:L-cysteine desulfhydrase Cds1 n=1 Tax=Sinobacterium caligoides TaxID=933926 RepID=A0A3N2DRA1_9GAMM|nr:PLP-dependent cysteine synthase family protein [Sinobacterium caligoides]ROS01825.1 cysteine synthase A [Sinobacterium caligoides]
MRAWVNQAVQKINADYNRSADSHLIKLEMGGLGDIDIYLKDESCHPTGSLKHRLARSLFLYAICNGWIGKNTPVIESSSGSTAVSEAYFARLLGLEFIAVVPKSTSPQKLEMIKHYGGRCHLVEPSAIYDESRRLAQEMNGHYMDQFTYAERATDWRGNNNIAESTFAQLSQEPNPIPEWLIMGAGTGGTTATLGRFIRYHTLPTQLCLADPENSVFHQAAETKCRDITQPTPSRIEGIGRPRVEPSFIPELIDRSIKVPDAASVACVRFLEGILHRKCGGSTGTNLWATLQLASELKGQKCSLVTFICDGGERYTNTYYNDDWVRDQQMDLSPYNTALESFTKTGILPAV